MQSLSLTSVLCLITFTTTALCSDIPDGYMLALKVVQIDRPQPPLYYNHASLFKIEFDGSVSQFWNYSYDSQHTMFGENLFAIDTESQLIYLGVVDQLLALDLTSGVVKIKIPLEAPNLQYFWNYDYIAKEKAIYGVCTGHRAWNWCRIKLDAPLDKDSIKVENLYQFPGTNEFGPIDDIYYMDKEHQSIWYLTSINFANGVNYTTGERIFYVNSSYQDDCIAHDHDLNKTFTITNNRMLAELHPWPRNETALMKIPPNLGIAHLGSCSYDPKTHTLIGLMLVASDSSASDCSRSQFLMPSNLLLIDVVNLTYKTVPLPGFKKWNWSWPITAVKFIPTGP